MRGYSLKAKQGNPSMPRQRVEMVAKPDSIAETRHHQDAAALAYDLWQAKGRPNGSHEAGWIWAERELQSEDGTEGEIRK